ncbi:uncharacterized protein LOC109815670 [Cajanus cajan]|uniref:Uncharacterized protein n=1 Tax=Cajanus cajan TaxID=3821 RepID=A0A151RUU7_CAJCA|nr:uncharacterized protein LOC109815670 [Cajanus cajan]KYP46311.1 hypothetical protein KK1_032114 [Cajanus cajan]
MEQLKAFAKSGHDFFDGLFGRRNPVEILKRLQREAFSDLMRLRDRQEKLERLLSFYQTSKGGPFRENATHVRGHVDFSGALLVLDNVSLEDAADRWGIRTGVDSRFIFETTIGDKGTGSAEFVATHREREHCDQKPLSLNKLSFTANVNDWFSLVALPIGARCRDVAIASNSFHQVGKRLTEFSCFGPPLLNSHNGTAIGITVRKSNVIASLAQLVTGLGMPPSSNTMENRSSTFGQLAFQFPRGTKLSVLGVHQVPLSSRQLGNFGALTIPIVFKQNEVSESVPEASPLMGMKSRVSADSIALLAESELDGFTKIGGWIEMNKLNPKSVQLGVIISDDSEDSLGWGTSLSGTIGDSANGTHFQAESYLKFSVGNNSCLKPGLVLGMDGKSKIAALMLQSNWSL